MQRARIPPTIIPLLGVILAAGIVLVFVLVMNRSIQASALSTPAARSQPTECSLAAPCMALIIDDIGRDLTALQHLLALEEDITFAILPHALYTDQSIRMIKAARREIILHLPMDPLDRTKITDERVVLGRDSLLTSTMAGCLDRVPDAVGINNHMGSAMSQNKSALHTLLGFVAQRKLVFLDSKTTSQSRICEVARAHHLPCLERDVFLDDPPTRQQVETQWEEAVGSARKHGRVIAIAHPLFVTIERLRSLLKNSGIKIHRLSGFYAGLDAT